MTCVDCVTTTPPPTCPDPPNGSNCCLRLKYTCAFGVWALTSSDCVDNALCSPLIQICEAEDFYYEQQNGCVCFSVPDPVCTPTDVDCSCDSPTTTTSTTTTTTTTTTSTTTTTTSTTTTTTPPSLCPVAAGGSWDFDVSVGPNSANLQSSGNIFDFVPAGANANCCYQVVFTITGNVLATAGSTSGSNRFSGGEVRYGPFLQFHTGTCKGSTLGDPLADATAEVLAGQLSGSAVLAPASITAFICGTQAGVLFGFSARADTTGTTLSSRTVGTISWAISLADAVGCA